jgi:lactocepin
LELGDDPTRSGVYKMSINLKNLSDQTVSYRLGNIAMTESLSTSDPDYVAEMGYLLSHSSAYEVTGDGTLVDGVVSVAGGKTAVVTLTITLSAQDKAYLNESFENGMFIEGFMTFDNTDENGVDLNAPFLAFYGDWADAPIFDLDYYEVQTEAHNDAIDEDDKIKADYYATTPLGSYYYDYIIPLGGYLYKMDENEYEPIPATRDKAALSYYSDSISGLYGVLTGLLRGAKELDIKITNTATGEVVWSETQYNCYKSHYAGGPRGYYADMRLPMVDTENGQIFGYNNTKYEVTMSAKLDWDGETRNSKDNYSFSFYIDYEVPTVNNAVFRTEYDKARKENRYYVDLMVYDNHYAQSIRPVIVYDIMEDGQMKKTYSSLCEYPIPIYQ